ncbi:Gti1/Pac2 family-domain-containing protein [Coniochaeta sp. 2T2.1]|nr:Gti1/Pac2 family-domain-containing protein [Coniochaeta sp. 2T2.1]
MSDFRPSLAGSQSHFQPTYQGFVDTTRDVCLLVEMCLNGRRCHVPRLPYDSERRHIIQSGDIFIYEEGISGIQRWTDGINWSPSCTLGNFLIYREIEPGSHGDVQYEKAMRRTLVASTTSGSKPAGDPQNRGAAALPVRCDNGGHVDRETLCLEDQELYGADIHSYAYKPNGFAKKTITVSVEGVPHHLVSYYTDEAVRAGRLQTPTQDPLFWGIIPRESLIRSSSFQVTIEHEESRMLQLGYR